jgi:hypothetical protein
MKTQSFSHAGTLKKIEIPQGPLAKLGLNAAKYLLSRLRAKS